MKEKDSIAREKKQSYISKFKEFDLEECQILFYEIEIFAKEHDHAELQAYLKKEVPDFIIANLIQLVLGRDFSLNFPKNNPETLATELIRYAANNISEKEIDNILQHFYQHCQNINSDSEEPSELTFEDLKSILLSLTVGEERISIAQQALSQFKPALESHNDSEEIEEEEFESGENKETKSNFHHEKQREAQEKKQTPLIFTEKFSIELAKFSDSLAQILKSDNPKLEKELNFSLCELLAATKNTFGTNSFKKDKLNYIKNSPELWVIFNYIILTIIRYDKSNLLNSIVENNAELTNDFFLNFSSQIKVEMDSLEYCILYDSEKSLRAIQSFIGNNIAINHLKSAINSSSEKCFAYLLKSYSPEAFEKEELIKLALKTGNLTIIKLLIPDQELAIKIIFDNFIKHLPLFDNNAEDDLISTISLLYLKTKSIQEVENICKNLLDYIAHQRDGDLIPIEEISKTIEHARNLFPKWVATRYTSSKDIAEMQSVYGTSSSVNLKNEMEYGLFFNSLVEKFLKESKETKSKFSSQNLSEDYIFSSLPSCQPPEKFFSMREFLAKFAVNNSEINRLRGNKKHYDKFSTFRNIETETKCSFTSRYGSTYPFIEAMSSLAKDDDPNQNLDSINFKFSPSEGHVLPETHVYSVKYKNKVLTDVHLYEKGWIWRHGRCDPKTFWPDVERLNKEVLDMDLSDFASNPEKIRQFYAKIAETIGLIGHITPLERGTGRFVEFWLATVHDYFELPRPVLNTNLQLDCLDITLELEVYKDLFLNLFDQDSFIPAVKEYNKNRNNDTIISCLTNYFNVPLPNIPSHIPIIVKTEDSLDKKQKIAFSNQSDDKKSINSPRINLKTNPAYRHIDKNIDVKRRLMLKVFATAIQEQKPTIINTLFKEIVANDDQDITAAFINKFQQLMKRNGINLQFLQLAFDQFVQLALSWGQIEVFKQQLPMILPNAIINEKGQTALILAAECGHADIVELLLEAGAKVDLQANNGQTALAAAAENGHADIVEILLDHNADPKLADRESRIPINWAEEPGYADIEELLTAQSKMAESTKSETESLEYKNRTSTPDNLTIANVKQFAAATRKEIVYNPVNPSFDRFVEERKENKIKDAEKATSSDTPETHPENTADKSITKTGQTADPSVTVKALLARQHRGESLEYLDLASHPKVAILPINTDPPNTNVYSPPSS